jgi:hypothetical protein
MKFCYCLLDLVQFKPEKKLSLVRKDRKQNYCLCFSQIKVCLIGIKYVFSFHHRFQNQNLIFLLSIVSILNWPRKCFTGYHFIHSLISSSCKMGNFHFFSIDIIQVDVPLFWRRKVAVANPYWLGVLKKLVEQAIDIGHCLFIFTSFGSCSHFLAEVSVEIRSQFNSNSLNDCVRSIFFSNTCPIRLANISKTKLSLV